MMVMMGLLAWWERLSGATERRESRRAYLEALGIVAAASTAQTQMIHTWLNSFNQTSADAVKGWAVDERQEWLQDQQAEHPEKFIGMPLKANMESQISWLESQAGQL